MPLFDGNIGQYRECSFRLAGTGTFYGTESTKPTVGEKGRREDVSEWRLEVICPAERVDAAIAALRRAHSYEEPAYDVYPLRTSPSAVGEGRLGKLPRPTTLDNTDYQFLRGVGIEMAYGVGKIFKKTGALNVGKDWGVFTGFFSAALDA